MKPYICEGTIVKDDIGREGRVILTNKEAQVAVIRYGTGAFATQMENLEVVSYKEVE